MSTLLPNIQSVTKSDIVFLEWQQSNALEIGDLSTKPPILWTKSPQEEFFYYNHCYAAETAISSRLPWIKTQLISKDTPLHIVIPLLSDHEIVLVEDKNTVIGYVKSGDLLEKIFETYQHLYAYYETILETTDNAISIINHEEKMIAWTSSAEYIFNIPREEIIGKPATDFFALEMLQSLKTLRTGESVYRIQHQPREHIFVLINSNPVIHKDRIIGAVSAETDITSQILLQQELIHMSSKLIDLQNKVSKLTPSEDPFIHIVSRSQSIKNMIEMVKKVSTTRTPVLLTGESGVGKEVFSKAIHDCSEERHGPFIAINCGAIPPSLFESELFGYEGGAFSGSNPKGKKGKFELANGGTLLLDEIGEISLDMQVKLLRVIEEKTYYQVGGTKTWSVNCRIIAATNQNLERMIEEGTFRKDLYYRLQVISLDIPPLRKRKEDLFELIQTFLHEFSVTHHQHIKHFPDDVFQALLNYDWPGNIRELRNTIERLVIFSIDGEIKKEHLPNSILRHAQTALSTIEEEPNSPFQAKLDAFERKLILEQLQQVHGNKNKLAKKLGISRATLYNKMNRLNI
ncbi:histidine kinase [Bacillus sp. FJAT-27916]|uniref:sigma-54 interaction domain-containing protein n=1 Tax=Bacillaceae TaxID=186817 RepID=UPI000670DF1C|nr:sigma-54-dependent Fis family transcriptional regulator [Bacillus sp. FJAT-27916]KMY46236.1 histidine kinase [Bacillus sp. FJAT-27916]